MTDQEINESNHLIGLFMGKPEGYTTDYHCDWKELMPVVEKIALYRYPDEYDDYAYPRTFAMQNAGQFMVRINRCCLFSSDKLIEATWYAVVDFIKYYNTAHPSGQAIDKTKQ